MDRTLRQSGPTRSVTPLSYRRLRLPPMRASIRDIVVAIAFGNIVYRLIAHGDDASPFGYRERTYIRPSERLYRLKSLLNA
jgi:hypothetical protein